MVNPGDPFYFEVNEKPLRMSRRIKITPDMIIAAVCLEYGRVKDDLLAEDRRRHFSEPRKVAAYLVRLNSHLTLQEVARLFLRNDHTTAISWIKWARKQRESAWFQRVIEMVHARLKQLDDELVLAW
jgi:chromosomal replication initiation ATPase DnaA